MMSRIQVTILFLILLLFSYLRMSAPWGSMQEIASRCTARKYMARPNGLVQYGIRFARIPYSDLPNNALL